MLTCLPLPRARPGMPAGLALLTSWKPSSTRPTAWAWWCSWTSSTGASRSMHVCACVRLTPWTGTAFVRLSLVHSWNWVHMAHSCIHIVHSWDWASELFGWCPLVVAAKLARETKPIGVSECMAQHACVAGHAHSPGQTPCGRTRGCSCDRKHVTEQCLVLSSSGNEEMVWCFSDCCALTAHDGSDLG